jgi:pilus assembly protein CpaE
VVLEELLLALQRLQRNEIRKSGGSASGVNKINSLAIAILGSRGGIGCTSLAVNLGCTLASEDANRVSLVDLDLALGDADVALDLMPTYTLADMAINIERLDMTFLRRSLCKHEATGLSVLPHPIQLGDIGLIHEDHLQRVIGLLRASYTHLIVDLSKRFTPTDLTALRMSDVILLVAQLELTSLRNVVRMLLALNAEEGMEKKIKVVVNRVGSDSFDGEISLKKAEETIGKPIFFQIPDDPKAMMGSRNAGVPLLQHAPRSKLQQSIAQLAQALAGKDNPADSKKEKKGWFK